MYFEHGGRLVPEYRPLPEGEPERGLWDLLVQGPLDEQLDTSVDPGAELVQAAEPDEGRLLLEIGDEFWTQPPNTVYRSAAQIVFTMGNLEEGRAITLIDGLRAGRIEAPSGRVLDQPLTRADFPPPLIQVAQPVAGATVSRVIPIDVTLASEDEVSVSLDVGDRSVGTTVVDGGQGRLVIDEAPAGPAVVAIELRDQVSVEVPVTIAPRS